jgi:putative flippase GtrA
MTSAVRRLVSLYVSVQFARFIAVGGAALLIHWLSRFAFNEILDYGWAIVLAYGLSMSVAFILNKIYVFPSSRRSYAFEVTAFFSVNIAAFPFVWVAAYVLGEWVLARHLQPEISRAIAHGVAITLPVLVNFALHKLITFRGA